MKLVIGMCSLILSLGACSPSPSTERPRQEPAGVSEVQKHAQEQYLWKVLRQIAQSPPYFPKEWGPIRDTGTVLMRLTVSRNGQLLNVELERSSGSTSLDASGMETVRRASPYPSLPGDIPGDRYSFRLPMSYRPAQR